MDYSGGSGRVGAGVQLMYADTVVYHDPGHQLAHADLPLASLLLDEVDHFLGGLGRGVIAECAQPTAHGKDEGGVSVGGHFHGMGPFRGEVDTLPR